MRYAKANLGEEIQWIDATSQSWVGQCSRELQGEVLVQGNGAGHCWATRQIAVGQGEATGHCGVLWGETTVRGNKSRWCEARGQSKAMS